jgi:hypothetical protein
MTSGTEFFDEDLYFIPIVPTESSITFLQVQVYSVYLVLTDVESSLSPISPAASPTSRYPYSIRRERW